MSGDAAVREGDEQVFDHARRVCLFARYHPWSFLSDRLVCVGGYDTQLPPANSPSQVPTASSPWHLLRLERHHIPLEVSGEARDGIGIAFPGRKALGDEIDRQQRAKQAIAGTAQKLVLNRAADQ